MKRNEQRNEHTMNINTENNIQKKGEITINSIDTNSMICCTHVITNDIALTFYVNHVVNTLVLDIYLNVKNINM